LSKTGENEMSKFRNISSKSVPDLKTVLVTIRSFNARISNLENEIKALRIQINEQDDIILQLNGGK